MWIGIKAAVVVMMVFIGGILVLARLEEKEMGRAEKRRIEKEIKKRLTTDQYEDMKSATIREKVQVEVERFIANFVEVFIPAMREHRISEERANEIIADINARAHRQYDAGQSGEQKPSENFTDANEFEEVAVRVLEAYGDMPPKQLAKILFQEITKAGTEPCGTI